MAVFHDLLTFHRRITHKRITINQENNWQINQRGKQLLVSAILVLLTVKNQASTLTNQ